MKPIQLFSGGVILDKKKCVASITRTGERVTVCAVQHGTAKRLVVGFDFKDVDRRWENSSGVELLSDMLDKEVDEFCAYIRTLLFLSTEAELVVDLRENLKW